MQTHMTIDKDTWFFKKQEIAPYGEDVDESSGFLVESPLEAVEVYNNKGIFTRSAEFTIEEQLRTAKTPTKYFPVTTSEIIDRLLPLIDGKTITVNTHRFANYHSVFIPITTHELQRSVLSPKNFPAAISVKDLDRAAFAREGYGKLYTGVVISNSYNMSAQLKITSGIIRCLCTNLALWGLESGDKYSLKHCLGNQVRVSDIMDDIGEHLNNTVKIFRNAEMYADTLKSSIETPYEKMISEEPSESYALFLNKVYQESNNLLDMVNVFSFFTSHGKNNGIKKRADRFFEILPTFSAN